MPYLNLQTIRAFHIRENFQSIYKEQTKEEFELKLHKWYFWATHIRLKPICEAAKAKARGYRTFKNLKVIIYMLTSKLDYTKVGLPT